MIVAPAGLGGVAVDIDAGDLVMVADLRAANAAEKLFRAIRASAVERCRPLDG